MYEYSDSSVVSVTALQFATAKYREGSCELNRVT
jgi:hypothetical protein